MWDVNERRGSDALILTLWSRSRASLANYTASDADALYTINMPRRQHLFTKQGFYSYLLSPVFFLFVFIN